jgi:enamine deaminase RidA (YjgF/YER057c/UK114 family)
LEVGHGRVSFWSHDGGSWALNSVEAVTSIDFASPSTLWGRVPDEFVDVRRPPTSSLVQVAGLFLPDVLLEVEAVACVAG